MSGTRADAGITAAEIAGFSDETVREKTGRSWAGWVEALDAVGAAGMSHREIARHVQTQYDVSGWWSQAVTVGYERIRGLRQHGQRRGGSFEASRSRTFAVPVEQLYAMFADSRRRKRWLPEGVARVRTATAPRSMRLDWEDGTQVHLWLEAKGEAKASVSVTHVKLADQAAQSEAKRLWGERLEALRTLLEGSR